MTSTQALWIERMLEEARREGRVRTHLKPEAPKPGRHKGAGGYRQAFYGRLGRSKSAKPK